MANVQLAVAGDDTTQVILSVPGVQGPAGSNLPPSGTTHQLLYKQSSTDYDTGWKLITNDNVDAAAEIAVSKLADGSARQLLQTDAAGSGVEWTSNVDIPGTLDVTSAATFDATVTTTGLLSASGKISVPLASGEGPSIYFGTDTNTGIYSPGADQVAISTNGTGRLFVDANGRVGVGTASPADYSNASENLVIAGGANTGVSIVSNSATGASRIYFARGTSAVGSDDRKGQINYLHTDDAFQFATGASERLRITSTGELKHIGGGSEGSPAVYFAGSAPSNSLYVQATTGRVGVGTPTPQAPLCVSNGGANGIEIYSNYAGLGQSGITSYNRSTSQRTDLYISTGKTIFVTSGSERLYITADGELKHIGGGSVGDPAVYFAGSAPAKSLVVEATTGHVGVGTTDPYSTLDIGAGTMTVHAGLLDFRTNDNVSRNMYIAANATDGQFFCYATNLKIGGPTTIFENPLVGERARIDSSGAFRVVGAGTGGVNYAASFSGSAPVNSLNLDSSGRLLVGTSSALSDNWMLDAGQVQTAKDLYNGLQVFAASSSASTYGSFVGLNRARGAVASPSIVDDDDIVGGVYFGAYDGVDYKRCAYFHAEIDGTPDAGDLPSRLVFGTTSSGTSSPTPRVQINSSGALQLLSGCPGIDFSAIQTNAAGMTSETLDSYEEGTWTPNQGGGLTVNGAFSSSATYIKVGNIVHVRGYLAGATNISVSAGGILCTNLPFTTHTLDGCGGNATTYNINETAGLYATGSGTTLYSSSALSASIQIIFGFTYRAN